jgi:uncharacterized membrane protein (UPF0127 family)
MTKIITVIILLATPLSFAQDFQKKNLELGHVKIKVEIAETEEQQEKGLMFRKTLKENEGMLFVFQEEKVLTFWMKNTLIPLSIGFFDKGKKLFEVQEMQPISPVDQKPKVYQSKKPALYALEMPKGWFSKKKIKEGLTLKFEK